MNQRLRGRPAFGFGISLLAHAALLAWLVHTAPPQPRHHAPVARLQVVLLRLPPPPPASLPPASLPPPSTAAPLATPTRRPAAAPQRAAAPPPAAMLPAKEEPDAAEPAPVRTATASFDLQAARVAARAYTKDEGGGRGGADGKGSPLRATRDEALGRNIERARPSDCRTAYADMGVLAVIPLAASAVTGKGCKW
jgi:hypothetical protein